jgi:hypothetical protein
VGDGRKGGGGYSAKRNVCWSDGRVYLLTGGAARTCGAWSEGGGGQSRSAGTGEEVQGFPLSRAPTAIHSFFRASPFAPGTRHTRALARTRAPMDRPAHPPPLPHDGADAAAAGPATAAALPPLPPGISSHPPYTPRTILITGGAGFIGSHVAVRLATRYPQYKVKSRRERESNWESVFFLLLFLFNLRPLLHPSHHFSFFISHLDRRLRQARLLRLPPQPGRCPRPP